MKNLCPFCCNLLRHTILNNWQSRGLWFLSQTQSFLPNRQYAADSKPTPKKTPTDLSQYPVDKIRNFSIIAHVDHGKSTLADRLLEITGTIPKDSSNKQVLDKLQVERERGITVKAQTASLLYHHNGDDYLLNLIDTPGHVDFNYEVSRSLSACQGVLLLVDANQGVQAQTVANFYLAFDLDLKIIPVLNKIDIKGADPDKVKLQLKNLFDIEPEEVYQISAKHGTGVDAILPAVIENIPPPSGMREKETRALLIDSIYNKYRGVIAYFSLIDGSLKKGDKITSFHSTKTFDIQEIGFMYPNEVPSNGLYAGQFGYVICNMRQATEAQLGDTYHLPDKVVEPLPGFKQVKPMVYGGIYPSDQSEFVSLRKAVEKLTLNDPSVAIHNDSSPVLGQGFRLGFLGLLHMDVFNQRLEQEHNASVISTCPNVPYIVKIFGAKNIKKYGKSEITVLNPCHMPDKTMISEMSEPMVSGTIICPDEFLGGTTALIQDNRGVVLEQRYIDNTRLLTKVRLPLNEILVDFFDELKSITSGYASFDYEDAGYQVSNLVRLDFLINGNLVEELSLICHLSRARAIGTKVVTKLQDTVPKQLFLIALQACIGKKIIAREDIKPYRKDVTAKCYGGDLTRKAKLLRSQAEGKLKMRRIGKVEIPKDAFIKVLRR